MTTTTLRPNATVTGTPSTGTVHGVTSDDSDSTYATSNTAGNGLLVVDMGTVSMSGGMVKTIQAKCRGRTGSGDFSGGAQVVSGSTIYASVIPSMNATLATHTGTAQAITYSWTPETTAAQATATAAMQTLVDGFKMWGGGGVEGDAVDEDTNIRFYELYAILVWVAKPVTNVGTVTDPTTDRTSIPISWTNTLDSDGGGQTRYHVKVYTDAQYGAGGFDPDESTPYWDSGNTVSSATSTTTGSLVNDTYRAYVRVAQTVNGQAFWSDWDYDEFTVTVVAPEITSVTLAPDSLGVQQQGVVVTVNRDTTPDTAWNYIEVERTDVSGATWVPVRGATYVAPTGANSHVVTDYELPNGVTVKYRARATRIVSTLPLTGSWVESSTTSWTSTSLWLKAPLTPALNQTVTIREPFQTRSYASRVSVFPVIGSSTPVAIADVLQEPVQTLTIDTDTDAASSTLLTLLRETFLLYCPTACEGSTTQQYVAVTGVSMTPTVVKGKVRRRWSVTVVACDAPRDPLASAP